MQSLVLMPTLTLLPMLLFAATNARGESVVVDLRKGASDALIDFVPPPPGSPDRVSFTHEGMRIRQAADRPGRATGVTGFKSTLAASGDFTMTLQLQIRQLTGPKEGWGHGLIFAVFLDDPAQTVLKLNQLAYPGREHQSFVEISQRDGPWPFVGGGRLPLTDGMLVISRRGAEATFSVQPKPGAALEEIARHACPTSDVRTIEVWSTRVEKGNAPSDISIRQLTIESERFYSFKRPVLGWFTWWQGLIAAHVVVIVAGLGYRAWQNNRPTKARRP